MTRNRIIFGIVIAALFQTAILVQMVWSQITLLTSPTEVVLQTTPVDPRDFFRGDYVILDYKIASFINDSIPIDKELETRRRHLCCLEHPGDLRHSSPCSSSGTHIPCST